MANKPEENLNIHFAAMERITGISRGLVHTAKCLAGAGNEALSRELFEMSADIDASLEDARTAFTEEIMGRWSDGQNASTNMVRAALAGVVLGQF